MSAKVEFHEAANIFPLDEENLDSLAADIKANGQLIPIEMFDGKILDGRRRYLACERAGVEPEFRVVSPSDPVAYVRSLNLERRHLDSAQRAMCAARADRLWDKFREEAKARQREAQERGRDTQKGIQANLPESKSEGQQTRDKVGELFGVSGRSVDSASRVLRNAVPEVVEAVDRGDMAISTAERLSSEPPEVQKAEAAKPRKKKSSKKKPKLSTPAPVPTSNGRRESSLTEMLKWAAKRKRTTKADLAEEFNISEGEAQRRLRELASSKGYLVELKEDGAFKVCRAVHYPLRDMEDLDSSLREQLRKLYNLAKNAFKIETDNTSCEWTAKDRQNFLRSVMDLLRPLVKS